MQATIIADKHSDERSYSGAVIELPANRFEIVDALQRAFVPDEGGYTLQQFDDWPAFLRMHLILSGAKTLEQVNFLADKVSRMDEIQLETYEGALHIQQVADYNTLLSMTDLINTTYNLDSFDFHPGVVSDGDLGEICMTGGMLDLVDNLPDEAADLLDARKVGEAMRRNNQGTFTSNGYVFRGSNNWQEVYDGQHLPEQPEEHGLISLHLVSANHVLRENREVWLELPADEQAIERALTSLNENSLEECFITDAKSILPSLPYQLAGDEDIGRLNTLAKRIEAFPDSRTLTKYKAILELECQPDLDRMLDITQNMNCYDYDTVVISDASYAEYLFHEGDIDISDPAFSNFDFKGYGKRQSEGSPCIMTNYGPVSRTEETFVPEYTKPKQEMPMSQTEKGGGSRLPLDASGENYDLAEIDNRLVLFTNMRLDRDTIPDGIFCYDVRGSDNPVGEVTEIKPFIAVDHWGTILSKEPIPLNEYGSCYPDDTNYLGESMSLAEFVAATPEQLAAYQEPEPPQTGMTMK